MSAVIQTPNTPKTPKAAGAAAGPPSAARRKRAKGRQVWEENPTWFGQFGKGTVLAVTLAVIIVPVWAVIITSFSSKGSVNAAGGLVLVPKGLTLQNYQLIFSGGTVTRALEVSLFVTGVGTAVSMVVSVLCAYGLSRPRSLGQRPLMMLLIITMFFNGGLIPTFLVVNDFKLYGSMWAMILPGAVSVFNILIIRAFFTGTAAEMIEAARLDGASEWRVLWNIVIPTSRPVLAVMTMFYAVGYWGTFFSALLYEPDSTKWPLAMVVYEYTYEGNPMPGMGTSTGGIGGLANVSQLAIQMCVVSLSLVPIIVLTPFVQKHFAKGMLTGAIKG